MKTLKSLRLTGYLVKPFIMLTMTAAVFGHAHSAFAASCATSVDTTNVITQVDAHFDTAISEQTTAIIQALQSHASQMTENTQMAIRSQTSVQNAVDAREVNRRVEDVRQRAMTSTASGASTCNVVTGTISSDPLFAARAAWKEQVQNEMLDYYLGTTPNSPSSNGPRAAVQQRMNAHCQFGASASEISSGQCPANSPPAAPPNPGANPNAAAPVVPSDQNVNTFLNAPNGSLSPAGVAAANLFLTHAFEPHPLGAMPDNTANTEAGQAIAAARLTSAARSSIAFSVANGIVVDRNPYANQPALQSWAEGTAKQVTGYAPSSTGQYFPNGVSHAAMMDLRAKAWYYNPNWALSVDTHNADQNSKDIAMILSFIAVQNQENYHMQENIALTLATMLSIMEEQNRGQVN